MEFWAIAYQYQGDIFVDFSKMEDTMELSETCFLPTKKMAEEFIEETLSDSYVPVSIQLERLEPSGSWTYTRGKVDRWDEQA